MKRLLPPIDALSIIRFLHIHCFIYIFNVFYSKDASDYFSEPRFKLFKNIKIWFKKKQSKHALFYNILLSYQNEIILGSIITLIFASCNLLVPQLIKSFLQFMRERHLDKSELASAEGFIVKFFLVQFLRIVFGEHAKRLFYELAVQIESSLSRKLIKKALTFEKSCRDRIHKSSIMQLQNVDLKLIFTMFKNMYLWVEAPFTIIVAIILLFRESHVYGFIGIYWFIIAFLVQRQLDSRMIHCNQTKFKLIDQRSRVNYELFGRIKQAKLIHYQDLIVQKNNDLFIEQNHDHCLFYYYSTLYDITLLILPIIVVVTISLFDVDNENHITVEQVYIMLELLGICYNPMKSFRIMNISMHDGFIALSKCQNFFDLPDQVPSTLIQTNIGPGELIIQQNTQCTHSNSQFILQINHHIELKRGQRLILIGRKGQGKSSFMRMILGQMKKNKGSVFINSKIATSLQSHFFRKASVLQNIIFSQDSEQNLEEYKQIYKNNSEKLKQINQRLSQYKQKIKLTELLYKQFDLEHDFASQEGINTIIEQKTLTKKQMKKISLARAFAANPQVYVLQAPFEILDKNTGLIVQKKLRQKQRQGKTVIMSQTTLEYVEPHDKILVLEQGASTEYDSFSNLLNNKESQVYNYFKSKEDKQTIKQPDSARKLVGKFSNRVLSAMSYCRNSEDTDDENRSYHSKENSPTVPYVKYRSLNLAYNLRKKRNIKQFQKKKDQNSFWKYFVFYINSLSFVEIFFILLIIAVAQFLHIFIHYQIGHLDESEQDNAFLEFKNILILESILTIALALIIYFEGEVSSLISVIQGNILYEKSIKSVVKKPIKWFYKQFYVKLADKFNHDYQQIFIACHNLLGIYKNIIILIITIYVVSAGRSNIFVNILFVCAIYISIGVILRKVKHKIIKHFYDYKYEFVKIFEECLDGGITFQTFGAVDDVLKRTNNIYKNLAAYKLAESYTAYGEEMLCDFVSLILLVAAFFYGLQIKLEGSHYNLALIGTTIHLLLNVSEVLKNIVKLTINFQSFFNLNIVPFLQMAMQKQFSSNQRISRRTVNKQKQQKEINEELSFQIVFNNVYLFDEEDKVVLNDQKINLTIQQESTVSIYEENQIARAKLVQALTKNYLGFQQHPEKIGRIKFGKKNIIDITDEEITDYITVIMSDNFFWTGATLRENITWRKGPLTPKENQNVISFAKKLGINQDLTDFDEFLLDSQLSFNDSQINSEFNKKIAVLRTLIKKPKIIILKNTSSCVGEIQLIQLLRNESFCTVIKVTGNINEIPGMNRVIYMENLKILQNNKLSWFEKNKKSKIGELLQSINLESYEYFNKGVSSPGKAKKNKKRGSPSGFKLVPSTLSKE